MKQFIMLIIGSIIVIAGGVTAYYFYSKPKQEIFEFSKKFEALLNNNVKQVEKFVESDDIVRNMVKFKVQPYVCTVKQDTIKCSAERLYIAGPFVSYYSKVNNVTFSIKDNNTIISSVQSNGDFEIESSPYTKSFKTNIGFECDLNSKFISEDGIFQSDDKCISNFGTLKLDSTMDYSIKDDNIKNKNIYDAVLEYYKVADLESDLESDVEDIAYSIAINALSFNLSSVHGIFENVYKYIDDIVIDNEYSREEILEDYRELQEEIQTELAEKEVKSKEDEFVYRLLTQTFSALDSVMLDNHTSLSMDIIAQNKNKFYSIEDLEFMDSFDTLLDEFIIKVKSEK